MSMQNDTERSYVAFISYRHKDLDRKAALKVQQKIENYIVPKELREKTGGKKLGVCFRDEDELPASSSLSDSIYYALDHTKFLIVICTPDLPQSKWCEAEIRYFLKTHDRDHILAVLADGEPEESFSPYMLHEYNEAGEVTGDVEPLAAHISGPDHTIDRKALKKEIVRLCAALIGCPFDELWQRERRAKTARILAAGAVILAVMAVFLGVVLNRNAMIEEKNREISRQNQQISEQNDELQTQMSATYTDAGNDKLQVHDVDGAVTDGLNALESSDPGIYDHGSAKLLSDALCAYKSNAIRSKLIYEQSVPIKRFEITDDEKIVVFIDENYILHGLDLETREILWDTQTNDSLTMFYTKGLGQRVLYKNEYGVTCISAADGSVLWTYEHPEDARTYIQALSEDGQVFALADCRYNEYDTDGNYAELVFLNTQDGHELGRTDVMKDKVNYKTSPRLESFRSETDIPAASFSADGSVFVCEIPGKRAEEDEENAEDTEVYAIFTVDMNDFSRTDVAVLEAELRFFYGIDADPEDESVFFAAYYPAAGGIYTALCTKGDGGYEYKTELTNHVYNSETWFIDYSEYPENACHMLCDGSRVIVFSNDEMFVFRRDENKLQRLDSMTGVITDARWIDKEADVYEIDMYDGSLVEFVMDKDVDSGTVFPKMNYFKLDLNQSWHTIPLNGGILQDFGSGEALIIDGNNRGRILLSEFVSDENRKDFSFPDEGKGTVNSVAFIPDSDYVLVTCDRKNALYLDKDTGELEKKISNDEGFGFYMYGDVIALDEDHILIENNKYGPDGQKEVFSEPVTFKDDGSAVEPEYNIQLSDGSVLSWANPSASFMLDKYVQEFLDSLDASLSADERFKLYLERFDLERQMETVCFWKDGKPVEEFNQKENMLVIARDYVGDNTFLKAGRNGLFMAFCRTWQFGDHSFEAGDEEAFHFMDTSNGQQTVMENRYPDSGKFTAALGNTEHLAAVAYEDGTVCIYEPDENRTIPLETKYTGEVLGCGFSENDEYLILYLNTGRLDIYETGTWSLVFDEKISEFGNYISEIRAVKSADGDTLLIFENPDSSSPQSAFIDITDWTLMAEVSGACYYDPDKDRIYGIRSPGYYYCPLYGIEDLKKKAQAYFK